MYLCQEASIAQFAKVQSCLRILSAGVKKRRPQEGQRCVLLGHIIVLVYMCMLQVKQSKSVYKSRRMTQWVA